MRQIILVMRTNLSALVAMRTEEAFSQRDRELIVEAAIQAPEDFLALTKVCQIPAGFDL